jgi:uncharacterized membrane protein
MLRDKNPKHWKLVIFYYNPDESRLFVPKRTEIPFTLDFAKPMAWAILAVTLAMVTMAAIINNAHFVR